MNSNQPNISFDASRFYDFVKNMDKKYMAKAEREALQGSMRLIATQTRRNLRSRWPGAYSTEGGRRIAEGVISNVQKSTDGRLYGQAHIMGTRAKDSRSFILRFYEMGTVNRVTKAGHKRGKISPLWFFRDAVAAKKQQVFGEVDDKMEKAVVKQWMKSASKGGNQ